MVFRHAGVQSESGARLVTPYGSPYGNAVNFFILKTVFELGINQACYLLYTPFQITQQLLVVSNGLMVQTQQCARLPSQQ